MRSNRLEYVYTGPDDKSGILAKARPTTTGPALHSKSLSSRRRASFDNVPLAVFLTLPPGLLFLPPFTVNMTIAQALALGGNKMAAQQKVAAAMTAEWLPLGYME